jgi:hypothetical protein
LSDYELKLIDHGCDAADLAAAVERLLAKHTQLREQAIEKLRAMVARGGRGLQ